MDSISYIKLVKGYLILLSLVTEFTQKTSYTLIRLAHIVILHTILGKISYTVAIHLPSL